MKIKINYDGEYPNLCGGNLIVFVEGKEWIFPQYCLKSGGNVWFGDDWEEHIESGPWTVSAWPENFPEKIKETVIDVINETIPYGCCGGCI